MAPVGGGLRGADAGADRPHPLRGSDLTPSHVVFATQVVDADHPALAQTIDKIRVLATRFDRVSVLCDHVGEHDLPENVALHAFGARSRAGRGLRFERELARALRRPGRAAVLAHMIPTFLLLAAPLARLHRAPLLLWYTHWNADRSLRLATRVADTILSVDRRSFPVPSAKVRGIGHAIDVERFSPRAGVREPGPFRLLALGRTARWKGYETMLDALELVARRGVDAELEIRGPQLTADEHAHRGELERRIAATPELAGRVRIEPPVPRAEIPRLLTRADALLSATQPRASETLDKVVYEAGACGVPVLASNSALDEYLDGLPLRLRFAPRDGGELADLVVAIAAADESQRAAVGAELRRRVVAHHSLDSWATAVVAILAETRRE